MKPRMIGLPGKATKPKPPKWAKKGGRKRGFEGKTATAIAYRFIYRFWSSGKEYEQWSTPWEHFHMDYKITHWMPLPEPPKEVNDGN